MKSISALLLLILLVVLGVNRAVAQASLASLDAKTFTDNVPPIQRGDRSFTIEPSYVLKDMTAGHSVKFTITITAPSTGSDFLELRSQPVMTTQDSADKFQFKDNGMQDTPGVVYSRKYNFIVKIDEKVEPRRHQVVVGFALPGESDKQISLRYFDLYVGVNSGGKLVPAPTPEDASMQSFETGFFAGQKHVYNLALKNQFPDYTVSIKSIKLESESAGLIDPQTFTFEDPITLSPSEVKTIPLEFNTKPLRLLNLLKGIGTTPRLRAEIFYNDGNERSISDFKPREAVLIPPTGGVLFGSVVLGLIFGAGLRTLLEFMLFRKKISRRSVIKVVSYSLLFGMLLVVLVALGQIEIKAKSLAWSSSYDNPLAMLGIGLIGALAGVQLIIAWYKSLKAD